MAVYAIGDVQGCYQSLKTLLQAIRFSPDKDQLWLVGDLVNRGSRSLETLRFIYGLRDHVHMVLGNHDMHLLSLAYGIKKPEKNSDLVPILAAADKLDMLSWLQQQPLARFHPKHETLMVHAGILPGWSLPQVLNLSREVQQAMQHEISCKKLLRSMYRHKPKRFKEKYQGTKRLRTIVNVMTRMRFCKANGKQNFSAKGDAAHPPEGYQPWFHFFAGHPLPFSLLFGHWSALGGQCPIPGFYALDTGCVWGRSLTAMRLSDKKRFQVACTDKP